MEHLNALVDPECKSDPEGVQAFSLQAIKNIFFPWGFFSLIHIHQVSFHSIAIHSLFFLFHCEQCLINIRLHIAIFAESVIEEVCLDDTLLEWRFKVSLLEFEGLLLVVIHHFSCIFRAQSLGTSLLRAAVASFRRRGRILALRTDCTFCICKHFIGVWIRLSNDHFLLHEEILGIVCVLVSW